MSPIAKLVLDMMKSDGTHLVTAESCTAGMIASSISSNPGASSVLIGGFIVYNNDMKSKLLGIDPKHFEVHDAVSEETAKLMAIGALRNTAKPTPRTWSIAITGNLGPFGPDDETDGIYHVAIMNECLDGPVHRSFRINGRLYRLTSQQEATTNALTMFYDTYSAHNQKVRQNDFD